MALYHFSEDPGIERFVPHIAKTSHIQREAFVWAIDDWHAPMYAVPRDCPRACFWSGPHTTPEDRDRWFDYVNARFVVAIETEWLARLRATRLYRYVMPEEGFEPADRTAGHWVARTPVVPLRVEPMTDLLAVMTDAAVELRVTPRLGPLWRRVRRTSLEFSGTRLRNAKGFPEEFD